MPKSEKKRSKILTPPNKVIDGKKYEWSGNAKNLEEVESKKKRLINKPKGYKIPKSIRVLKSPKSRRSLGKYEIYIR